MAVYKIYNNGEEVNRIIAEETFIAGYCDKNGYIYELEPETEPVEPEPTAEEIINAMLGVSE